MLLLPLQDSCVDPRIIISIFKLKLSRLKMRNTSTRGKSERVILQSCTSLNPRVARRLQSRHSSKAKNFYTWKFPERVLSKKNSRRQDSSTCRHSSKSQTFQMALRSSFQSMLSSLLMISSPVNTSMAS
jgi:hypothetical protein